MKWRVAFLVVAVALVLFWFITEPSKPDLAAEYRYAIENPDLIQKIKIDYRLFEPDIVLERRSDAWWVNHDFKARKDAIENLLDALHRINLQFIPRPAAQEKMIVEMAATATKVEVFGKNEELLKSFFIGGTTPDERGTYIILEGTRAPAVVSMDGFEGSLMPRFAMPLHDWRDRMIFEVSQDEIKELVVHYPSKRESSFVIRRSYEGLQVYPLDDHLGTGTYKRGSVEAYLQGYKFVGAEAIIVDTTIHDSLIKRTPFVEIELTKTDDSKYAVQLFPVVPVAKNYGNQRIQRYHLVDSKGDIFLIQHRVFEKLFLGLDYFFEE